ncbi:MAG: hypothetical protein IT285_16260, partial [Bdellovibrionales bacterium]|nr:hypothetical protein [Bdellovibrionales bacterium]
MANRSTKIDRSLAWRPLSSPPESPELYEVYLDATEGLLQWNGSAWVPFASAPSTAGINFLAAEDRDGESPNTNWYRYNDTQTVTITNASPGVFTVASTTGYYNGMPITFSTTGALPTGLTALTTYYVTNLGVDGAGKYRVSATLGGADVNTSSAGSGTHTARPLVPTTAVGASSSLNFAITSTAGEVIRGDGSYKGAKDAAVRAGEGFAVPFTVDDGYADYPRSQVVKLAYRVTADFDYGSGTTVDPSDITAWVLDLTTSRLIPITPFTLDGSGQFVAEFQPDKGSSDFILALHVSSVNALAWDFIWDDNSIGPADVVPQATVTKPKAYTPTFTGFGTVASVNFHWHQVGSVIQINGRFTTGTVTATEARISLPNGLTVDADIFSADRQVGAWGRDAVANTERLCIANGGQTYFKFTTASNGLTALNGSSIAGSSELITVQVEMPITGWDSGALVAVQDAHRSVHLESIGHSPSGTISTTFAGSGSITFGFPSSYRDNSGSFNGTTFTVPTHGDYLIQCQVRQTGTEAVNDLLQLFVAVNGVERLSGFRRLEATVLSANECQVHGVLTLNSGDLVTFRFASTTSAVAFSGGATSDYLTITRIGAAAAVLASEKVRARYTSTSGQSIPNSTVTVINFDTKEYDSHNKVATGAAWKFTADVAGVYSVKA